MSRLQLRCPLCGGLFQAESSWAGRDCACPMCGGTVTIPSVAQAPPAYAAAPTPVAPSAPLRQPPPKDPAPLPLPAPPVETSPAIPGPAASDRMPPARPAPPSAGAAAVETAPAPEPGATFKYPPGMGPNVGPVREKPAEKVEKAESHIDRPVPVVRPAKMPSGPAASLPPTSHTGIESSAARSHSVAVELLLPPAVDGRPPMVGPGPVPLMSRVALPTMAAFGSLTLDPTYSAVVDLKEPVKKVVTYEGEQIELRRLSPEEKTSRRRRKNLIMAAAALAIIGVALAILLQM